MCGVLSCIAHHVRHHLPCICSEWKAQSNSRPNDTYFQARVSKLSQVCLVSCRKPGKTRQRGQVHVGHRRHHGRDDRHEGPRHLGALHRQDADVQDSGRGKERRGYCVVWGAHTTYRLGCLLPDRTRCRGLVPGAPKFRAAQRGVFWGVGRVWYVLTTRQHCRVSAWFLLTPIHRPPSLAFPFLSCEKRRPHA